MKRCVICGSRLKHDDDYCHVCDSYVDEYDDFCENILCSYDIDTDYKIKSQTLIFKDIHKTKEEIFRFIKDLYNQYDLSSCYEYRLVYYNKDRHGVLEHILYSNNDISVLTINKYKDFIYFTIDTYDHMPITKDIKETKPIINILMYFLFSVIVLYILLFNRFYYLVSVMMIILFILLYLFFYRVIDYIDTQCKNKQIIKSNQKVIEKWEKDNRKNKKYHCDHHFIKEQLKDYIDEYIDTKVIYFK